MIYWSEQRLYIESAFTRKETLADALTWMSLEDMLGETNRSQPIKVCDSPRRSYLEQSH